MLNVCFWFNGILKLFTISSSYIGRWKYPTCGVDPVSTRLSDRAESSFCWLANRRRKSSNKNAEWQGNSRSSISNNKLWLLWQGSSRSSSSNNKIWLLFKWRTFVFLERSPIWRNESESTPATARPVSECGIVSRILCSGWPKWMQVYMFGRICSFEAWIVSVLEFWMPLSRTILVPEQHPLQSRTGTKLRGGVGKGIASCPVKLATCRDLTRASCEILGELCCLIVTGRRHPELCLQGLCGRKDHRGPFFVSVDN